VPDSNPLPENEMPAGRVDGVQPLNAALENVGAGLPDAVTWKEPALPTKKLVELALLITGAPVSEGGGPPVGAGLAAAWPVVPEN
jgi:hypothetical protein